MSRRLRRKRGSLFRSHTTGRLYNTVLHRKRSGEPLRKKAGYDEEKKIKTSDLRDASGCEEYSDDDLSWRDTGTPGEQLPVPSWKLERSLWSLAWIGVGDVAVHGLCMAGECGALHVKGSTRRRRHLVRK